MVLPPATVETAVPAARGGRPWGGCVLAIVVAVLAGSPAAADPGDGVLRGHEGGVFAARFTPDGTRVVTAGSDGTARLWDAAAGSELRRFTGHTGPITGIAVSGDGRALVTASQDNSLRIWDLPLVRPLLERPAHAAASSLALSPDGRTLITAGAGPTARLWDTERLRADATPAAAPAAGDGTVATITAGAAVAGVAWRADGMQWLSADAEGRIVLRSPFIDTPLWSWGVQRGGIAAATFVPGNPQQVLSAGGDGTLRVWQAPAATDRALVLAGAVRDVLPLPGQPHAVVAREDGAIQIVDLATMQPIRDLPAGSPVDAFAATVDGATLVVGDDAGRVRWLATADGADRGAVGGHSGAVLDVATTADGNLAYSAGADGTVRQWARPVPRIPLDGHAQGVKLAVAAADGQWFATTGDDATLRIWSGAGQSLRAVGTHPKPLSALAILPDARGLAAGDAGGGVSLWSPHDGSAQGAFLPHRGPIAAIAVDRDGSGLWTAAPDGTIKRSRLPLPTPRRFAGHSQPVRALVASVDGQSAYSGGQDQVVRQWDVATGQTTRSFGEGSPSGAVTAVATDGVLVAAVTEAGAVRAWRNADGAPALVANVPGVPQRGAVVLSAGAVPARIVTIGDDQRLRVWSVAAEPVPDGKDVVPVAEIPLPEPGTDRIVLAPDGTWLATAGAGRIARRFRVGPEGLTPIDGGVTAGAARITGLAFSPDGAFFAAAAEDGRVGLWDARMVGAAAGDLPPVRVIEHGAALRGLAFAAGATGTRLATAGDDGAVAVWDPGTGALVERFAAVGGVVAVTLSPGPGNGTILAAGGEPALWAWTPAVESVVSIPPAGTTAGALALVPLPGDAGVAALVPGERELRHFARDGRALPPVVAADGALVHAVTSADGLRCVVATAAGEAFAWDLVSDQRYGPIPLGAGAKPLAMTIPESPAAFGQILVGDGSPRLRAVDVVDGTTVEEWALPAPAVVALSTGPAGPGPAGVGALGRHWVAFGAAPQGWLQPRCWVRTLVDAPGPMAALALSADGGRLCAGGEDGRIECVRTSDGVVERVVAGAGVPIRSLGLLGPAPSIAAACADGAVRIWSLAADAEPRILRHGAALVSLAISPDGNRLATLAEDGMVEQWSTVGDTPLQSFPGHAPGKGRVRFLPDNLSMVSGARDRSVRVMKGTAIRSVRVAAAPITALVATGGGAIVATDDGQVLLVDPTGNAPPRPLVEGRRTPIRVALRPDGQRMAVADGDGRLTIHETGGWQSIESLDSGAAATALAWSGDGRRLAVATAASAGAGPLLVVFGPPAAPATPAPGREFVRHDAVPTGVGVTGLALDAGGRGAWCTHADGQLRAWGLSALDPTRRIDTGSPVLAVAISRDGGTIVSGGNDQSIRVWDAGSGEQRAQMAGHTGPVLALALTPDDALAVSASGDLTMRLWDVAGGRALKQLAATEEAVYSVAIDPTGRVVAAGGADRAIHLHDIHGGGIQRSLAGHADFVHSVAFNRRGNRLLSYGYAGVLKIWNPADGVLLHDAVVGRIGNAAGWGPAAVGSPPSDQVDDRIVAACGDGTVRIVVVPASAR